jgi:hypothetical protein
MVGCGAGMQAYKPLKEKTKFNPDALLNASIQALEERDHETIVDREKYTVDTREKEIAVSSVPKLSYKYTWHIETKDGDLSIGSTCKENSAMKRTEFKDCGDQRPEKLVKDQGALRSDILARAKTQ